MAFSGPRVRIGRSRDNDLVLSDGALPESSAHHAEAVVERGRWSLRDLDSTNGTFVNGERVSSARLRAGDSLSFGDDHLAVESRGSSWLFSVIAVLVIAAAALAYTIIGRSVPNVDASADQVSRSLYLIAFESPSGRTPLGTAFGVRADGLLAANAHVANELQQVLAAASGRGRAVALRSDSDEVRDVVAIHLHPRWRSGSIADDAALITIGPGAPVVPLRLADAATVERLPRGTVVAAVGFPAASVDAHHPSRRLTTDILLEVRGSRYLAVGLDASPGTSGSPIFTPDGVVVGLIAGGAPELPPSEKVMPPGVNWGISIGAVLELLALQPNPFGG